MIITGGEIKATTSGAIIIRSPNAGAEGVSGAVVLGSGSPGSGPRSSVVIVSCAATPGAGGAVSLTVGTGAYTTDGTLKLAAGTGVASEPPVSMAPGTSTTHLRAGR